MCEERNILGENDRQYIDFFLIFFASSLFFDS